MPSSSIYVVVLLPLDSTSCRRPKYRCHRDSNQRQRQSNSFLGIEIKGGIVLSQEWITQDLTLQIITTRLESQQANGTSIRRYLLNKIILRE
jgi:hypothetical protein